MIRINLLATERGKAKKKTTLDPTQQALIGGALILALGVAYVGWRFWSLSSQTGQLDTQIATEEREKQRLDAIIKQVQQFEAQRKLVTQRITLIEQLKSEQTGPVHMLDEISRALPDRMWLLEVKQGPNNEVAMDGNVTIGTRLPDFINNLEASGYFRRQIDILSTLTAPAPSGFSAGELDVTRFSIKAVFQPPGSAQPAAAPGAAGSQPGRSGAPPAAPSGAPTGR